MKERYPCMHKEMPHCKIHKSTVLKTYLLYYIFLYCELGLGDMDKILYHDMSNFISRYGYISRYGIFEVN